MVKSKMVWKGNFGHLFEELATRDVSGGRY